MAHEGHLNVVNDLNGTIGKKVYSTVSAANRGLVENKLVKGPTTWDGDKQTWRHWSSKLEGYIAGIPQDARVDGGGGEASVEDRERGLAGAYAGVVGDLVLHPERLDDERRL